MKSYRPYIALALVIFAFLALFFWSYQSEKFNIEPSISMSEDWTYDNESVTLPMHLDVDPNETYTIETTLSNAFREGQYLLIRSSLANIEVTLDGQVIYARTYGDAISNPYASMWHIIRIHHNSEGKQLTISFNSPYESMAGQVNNIFYGSEAAHYVYLSQTYGLRLAIAVVVAVIGLIMMLSDLFVSKKGNYRFAHLALFALLLSLWILAESRMLQFFTGSTFLIGSLAYLIIPLFPIPLITHLNNQVVKQYKKPLTAFQVIYTVDFIVVIVLYLTGIADFFESVIVSQILIIAGIITALIVLMYEVRDLKNQEAMSFVKALGVLVFFGLFELIGFAIGDFEHTSIFLSIGAAILMFLLLVQYIRYVIERMKLSQEKEFYEQLAFVDYVTQGKNRLAYEQDLKMIFEDKTHVDDMRLILFDLDNLKIINDNFGHSEGDKALKEAYDLISDVFQDYGTCYRIGGDEFACIYMNAKEEVFYEKQLRLSAITKKMTKQKPYSFRISYGSAVAKLCDMNMKDLIHLADLDMYYYKKKYRIVKEKGE